MTLAHVLLALSLAASSGGPSAPGPASVSITPEEARQHVSSYLGAIHAPVSADAFRALGPAAIDALADFAVNDPSPVRRLRALDALAALGGPRAEAVHRAVLASPTAPPVVRRGAVRGLGKLSGPAGAPAALVPVLEGDRDPAVRAAAAETLAAAAPAAACGKIRAQARVDPEPSRFGPALRACERASPKAPPAR